MEPETQNGNGTPDESKILGTGTIQNGFEFTELSREQQERVAMLQDDSHATIYRWENRLVTPEHERIIREKSLYVIPAFNEETRIPRVLTYLHALGIPEDRVTVMSCSTDGTDDVVRDFGFNLVRQEAVFRELLDEPRFLSYVSANGFRDLRGKGMTLFAGWLHLLASGKLNKHNAKDMHVVALDSDPQWYGTDPEAYDPVAHFAEVRRATGAKSIKPAKNGTMRNNQPVYVGMNALALMGDRAQQIQEHVSRWQWPLSGEMSREGHYLPHLVMDSGYPVETTMNISDAQLGMKSVQYADHRKRGDNANDPEKETIMYTQILRMMLAYHLYEDARAVSELLESGGQKGMNILEIAQHIRKSTGRRLVDYRPEDLAGVNAILAKDPVPIYVPDETNAVPEGVDVVLPNSTRLIGTVHMLVREKIARVPTWSDR